MKRRLVLVVALTVGTIGTALWSKAPVLAESACVECRKDALLKVQKCNANAKTEAEKKECTQLAQRLTKDCNQGACKDQGVK
jgi:hypothetical protein